MNAQHSPGPWEVRENEILDADGNTIADVFQANQLNWTEGSNVECMPGEANTKLIAAAPELLEALSECIHTWEHHNYIVEKETGLRILYSDEMVVNAKKLIAKLTDQ